MKLLLTACSIAALLLAGPVGLSARDSLGFSAVCDIREREARRTFVNGYLIVQPRRQWLSVEVFAENRGSRPVVVPRGDNLLRVMAQANALLFHFAPSPHPAAEPSGARSPTIRLKPGQRTRIVSWEREIEPWECFDYRHLGITVRVDEELERTLGPLWTGRATLVADVRG